MQEYASAVSLLQNIEKIRTNAILVMENLTKIKKKSRKWGNNTTTWFATCRIKFIIVKKRQLNTSTNINRML